MAEVHNIIHQWFIDENYSFIEDCSYVHTNAYKTTGYSRIDLTNHWLGKHCPFSTILIFYYNLNISLLRCNKDGDAFDIQFEINLSDPDSFDQLKEIIDIAIIPKAQPSTKYE